MGDVRLSAEHAEEIDDILRGAYTATERAGLNPVADRLNHAQGLLEDARIDARDAAEREEQGTPDSTFDEPDPDSLEGRVNARMRALADAVARLKFPRAARNDAPQAAEQPTAGPALSADEMETALSCVNYVAEQVRDGTYDDDNHTQFLADNALALARRLHLSGFDEEGN